MVVGNLELSPNREKHRELLKHTDEIVDLYTNHNMTLREIGVKFNTEKGAIKRLLVKNNIPIIKANYRKKTLVCIDCSQPFQGRKGCAKRCENCRHIESNKRAKEYQRRRRPTKHEIRDKIECLKCGIEIPNAPISREYCTKCRRVRAYENKYRAWRAKPRHYRMKSIEHQQNRRARKHGASSSHLDTKFLDVLSKKYNSCVYCNSNEKLTIDHVVPLSKNGDNSMDNLVLACKSCNSAKHSKYLLNFLWNRHNSLGDK